MITAMKQTLAFIEEVETAVDLRSRYNDDKRLSDVADEVAGNLRQAIEQAEQAEPEAWSFELATNIDSDGQGGGWQRGLTSYEPCVPQGMIRGLKPLYAAPAQEAWLPMESAPKDGTLLRLLVAFDDHATEDSTEPSPTIGCNSFVNTGEDQWEFAGWDWSYDCWTQGTGKPIGWLPMLAPTAEPSQPWPKEVQPDGSVNEVDPADMTAPAQPVKEIVVHADYRAMWAQVTKTNQELCVALSKALDAAPAQQPMTHEQRLDMHAAFESHKSKWNAQSILIDMVEKFHDIKGASL